MDFEGLMKLLLKPKGDASQGDNTAGGSGTQGPGNPETAEKSAETVSARSSILSKFGIGASDRPRKSGSWRHHLSPDIHNELNDVVQNTQEHRHAYKKTLGVKDAQLWVAVAQLSKRVKELESRLSQSNLAEKPVPAPIPIGPVQPLMENLTQTPANEHSRQNQNFQTFTAPQKPQLMLSGQPVFAALLSKRPGQP